MPQIPMGDQLYVGRGLNSATGKVYNTAIEFDDTQSVTSGQNQVLVLESVTSSRELTEKLSISASASLNMGNWGGSAGFKLTQLREINNYYTYALIRVVIQNPPLLLRNPRLKPEAEQKLVNEGWEAFSAAYGWEYVEGYIAGGSYYALIEIQTRSELQQQEVKGKLSGFYGPFGASTQVESTFKEIAQSTAINVLIAQSAGNGDPFETTLETMLDQARNFPALVSSSPVPIIALTADYQSTVSLPQVPPPNSLARIQQKNTLEDSGRQYLKLRDYKANLQFVLDHLTEFDDFRELDPQALVAKRQEYQISLEATANELDKIVQLASNCAEDLNQCQTYVSTVNLLPLPKIGGELMNLKQLEENLNVLREEIERVKTTANNAQTIANAAQSAIATSSKDFELGFVDKGYYNTAGTDPLGVGTGYREDINFVGFTPGKFSTPPKVVAMVSRMDADATNSFSVRLGVTVRNITVSGCEIVLFTSGDSFVYGLAATWIAFS